MAMTDKDMQALPTAALRKMLPKTSKSTKDTTPQELLALLLYRNRIRDNLYEWCCLALQDQGYVPALHHRLIIDKLEALERGDFDRLMIMMPPGSAKSTYCSMLFPAWYMQRHRANAVIASSNTQSLAESFGRRVRNLLDEHAAALGVRLSEDSQAAGQWRTEEDGVYLAAGVRGKITGRRADLAILDDPVASYADASNLSNRDTLWDWYRNDLYTRLKPDAKIILPMTRWHEDDISGRLEEAMIKDEGDKWHILRLPAIANSEPDPLGRKIGDALWPEWENIEALTKKRKAVGERAWSALFQQNPRPEDGAIFNMTKCRRIMPADIPAGCRWRRGWDLAATEQIGTTNPDWTVGALLGRTPNGMTIVRHVRRVRGTSDVVERTLRETAVSDGKGVKVDLPQDAGAGGKAWVAALIRLLSGFQVSASLESGSKANRAAPFAAQVNGGQVLIVQDTLEDPWNRVFTEELSGFPAASKDDQVDASSRAYNGLLAPPGRRATTQQVPGLFSR